MNASMNGKILENIKAGKFTRKELENLYSNAERLGRHDVLQAAKEALKQVDAKSYAKRFVKPIKDKVEEIARDIARSENWANWDDNKVGNGVKPGGAMLSGEELAE
jgi:hypothetical protein